MSQNPISQAQPRASSTKQGELPDGFKQILVNSIQIGTGAGCCGMLFGATAGIIRSAPPVLSSLVAGVHWFGLSSVFYGTRRLAIISIGPEHTVTPAQKVGASAMAGAISVVPVGLLIRGPRSISSGALLFSLLGAAGQFSANIWSTFEKSSGEKKTSWLDRKWSPMTRLSDEEYESILEEKLLKLDAEIAITDEHLTALRAQKEAQKVAEDVAKQSSLRNDKA